MSSEISKLVELAVGSDEIEVWSDVSRLQLDPIGIGALR
jgi:hypothetical protein